MPRWLKILISPRVFIPTLFIVGAVVLLFGFGSPKKIVGEMASFNRVDLIWIFLLSVLYEFVRFVQWLVLLREQGVKAPLKAQIFSFAGGEATRFIPVGNYFQNFLLSTSEGVDFAYTSAATTLIILYEVVVSLTGVVVLGLGILWWIRIVVVVGVALAGVAGWLIYKFHGNGEPPVWVTRRERLRGAWEAAEDQLGSFGKGARRILHPKLVAISLGLASIYLVAAGGVLYVCLAGVGWTQTPFGAVLAVYFFSLAIGLIFPLPVDIGVTELSGVGAFLAVGVERNAAISAMLINRVLTIGFSLVIFLIIGILMREETKRAWNARGARGNNKQKQSARPDADNDAAPAEAGDASNNSADRDATQRTHRTFTSGSVGTRNASPRREDQDAERADDQSLDTASA